MNITASMVKELREMTGAGMMECKKALTETDGNMEAAVDVLKKSGAAKAEKKASRIAAEGIARFAADDKNAVIVEVNSETDFVAKNEVFQNFVQDIADKALVSGLNGGKNGEDVEALVEKSGLKDIIIEKTATIGEKLSFRRFERVSGDCVATYIHAGGKIGVAVAGEGASDDACKAALNNVAMQIAAMNPNYINRTEISADELAKMKDITIESALNDPATLPKNVLSGFVSKAIADNMLTAEDVAIYEEKKTTQYLFNFLSKEAKAAIASVGIAAKAEVVNDKTFAGLVEGRVSKQLKEICLMDQTYVKAEDGKQSVAKYLESVNKDLKIASFVRFEVGEGMEKKNENFAEEVAKQMAGN